jgi:hypothetical protein
MVTLEPASLRYLTVTEVWIHLKIKINKKNNSKNIFIPYPSILGDAVAKYSGQELYKKILDSPNFTKGRPRDAIRNGYFGIDEALRNGTSTHIV